MSAAASNGEDLIEAANSRDHYECRLYVNPPVLTDEEAGAVARPEGVGAKYSFPFEDGLVGFYSITHSSPRRRLKSWLARALVWAAGLAANLTANPLEAVTTVTVQIVTLLVGDQEFDSAKTLAAFALGLMLFVVTLALNVIALKIVRRYREQYE